MAEQIEFGVNPNPHDESRAKLVVKCAHTSKGQCEFSLWRNPAQGVMWNWDGKYREPTISPSIDCHGGCGRHFTITAGRVA